MDKPKKKNVEFKFLPTDDAADTSVKYNDTSLVSTLVVVGTKG